MKKPKPALTAAPSKRVAAVPARKISEAILDFAAPVLEPIKPPVDLEVVRRALKLAICVWNFQAMATPVWGQPHFLEEARAEMRTSPDLATLFDWLVERRATLFGDDPRCVGEWSVVADGAGGFTLRCDARLPQGQGV